MKELLHHSPRPEILGHFCPDLPLALEEHRQTPNSNQTLVQFLKARLFAANPSVTADNLHLQPREVLLDEMFYYHAATVWHLDPVDQVIGYTSRPTRILEGALPISSDLVGASELGLPTHVILSRLPMQTVHELVEQALASGYLHPLGPIAPGSLILMPCGTLHRAIPTAELPPSEDRLFIDLPHDLYRSRTESLAA